MSEKKPKHKKPDFEKTDLSYIPTAAERRAMRERAQERVDGAGNLPVSGEELSDEPLTSLEALPTDEQAELLRYELVIDKGIESYIAVGQALLAIQQKKLYRATHRRFQDYVKDRFAISQSNSYRLIQQTETFLQLEAQFENDSSVANKPLPTVAKHLEALTQLPEEQRASVWMKAVEEAEKTGKPITGKTIRQQADQLDELPVTALQPVSHGQALDAVVHQGDPTQQLRLKISSIKRGQREKEVQVSVTGRFLRKHELQELWGQFRGIDPQKIPMGFHDLISVKEANELGLIDLMK